MQSSTQINSLTLDSALKTLRIALEQDFEDLRPTKTVQPIDTQRIVNILGKPLLQLYLSLNLDFASEITPLWRQYYARVFGCNIKICKSPFTEKGSHKYEEVSVMSAVTSVYSHLTVLEFQIRTSPEEAKKNLIQLFYDVMRYCVLHVEKTNDAAVCGIVKALSEEFVTRLTHLIKAKSAQWTSQSPQKEAHSHQQDSQEVCAFAGVQTLLSSSCTEAYRKLQEDLINTTNQESQPQTEVNSSVREIHCQIAELLVHFVSTMVKDLNSRESLIQTLIKEPIIRALAKYNVKYPDITFAELDHYLHQGAHEATVNNLSLPVYDANTGQTNIFSVETTPDAVVLDVVVASLSVFNLTNPVTIHTRKTSVQPVDPNQKPQQLVKTNGDIPEAFLANTASNVVELSVSRKEKESVKRQALGSSIVRPSNQNQPYEFWSSRFSRDPPAPRNSDVFAFHLGSRRTEEWDYIAIKLYGAPHHAKDYNTWEYINGKNWVEVTQKIPPNAAPHLFYVRYDWGRKDYVILGQPVLVSNMKDRWMESIFDSISSRTLAQIMIPGAHDAGSFNMATFLSGPISQCQDCGFGDMLKFGIRYFDCRLAYFPTDPVDQFYFQHGVANTNVPLRELLDDVSTFLARSSKEIVILDFCRFRERDGYIINQFVSRLNVLAHYIAPTNFASLTIDELVRANKRLVVLAEAQMGSNSSAWSANEDGEWPDTSSHETLVSKLQGQIDKKKLWRDNKGGNVTVTQAILTPPPVLSYGLGGALNIPFYADRARSAVRDNLVRDDWIRKVNIVITDYACTNEYVDIAIHANTVIRQD